MNQCKKPKISICIPTFNRCDLFERTLKSAIGQTRKPYEIIVIDNHSTDDTPKIVKKYFKYGIKYHRNDKNIGFVGNWNKCIDYAAGNYLCILHADDLIVPSWYEEWEEIISDNSDVDGFFSAWSFIDINDKVTNAYYPFNSSRKFSDNEAIKEIFRINLFSPAVSGDLILKKDLFSNDQIGRFDESLGTETDVGLYFPLMTYYTLYYYNKILFGYRIHPFQTMDREFIKKSDEKVIQSTQRYFNYVNTFYYQKLSKIFKKYDILYKKLVVTYQFKAFLKLIKGNIDTATRLNEVIKTKFPRAIRVRDYYLYFYLGFVFLKRTIVGKILSLFYKDLFSPSKYKYD